MLKRTLTVITLAGSTAFATMTGATATTTTERFTLITTSTADGPPSFSVVATGAFTDGGTATHDGTEGLTLHLTGGTITLRGTVEHRHDSKTETATICMQTVAKNLSYTIGQGTGAYSGVTGSGRATDDDVFIEQLVNGACATTIAAVQGVISASGPVSIS